MNAVYPVNQPIVLLLDSAEIALINLKKAQIDGAVLPDDIQAMVDSGTFYREAQAMNERLEEEEYFDISSADNVLGLILPEPANRQFYSSFSGVVCSLRTGERIAYGEVTLLCLLPAKKPQYFSAAYCNQDELIDEFKAALAGLDFPPNFDWEGHLVSLHGTDYD